MKSTRTGKVCGQIRSCLLLGVGLIFGCDASAPAAQVADMEPVVRLEGVELTSWNRDRLEGRASVRELVVYPDRGEVVAERLQAKSDARKVASDEFLNERREAGKGKGRPAAQEATAESLNVETPEQKSEQRKKAAASEKIDGDSRGQSGTVPLEAILMSIGARGRVPVEIEAENVSANLKEGVGAFVGSVRLTRGALTLTCNRLDASYDGETRQLEHFVATGDVRVALGARVGTCERLSLGARPLRIVLEGGPVLREGSDEIRGERIVWALESGKVDCERCQMTWSGPERETGAP